MSFSEEIRATGNFQRQFQKEKRRIQLSEIPKTDIDTLQTHVIDIRSHIHFGHIGQKFVEPYKVPIGPHQYILEPDYKSVRIRTKFPDVHGTGEYASHSHTVDGSFNIYNVLRIYDQAGVSGQKLWYYILAESPDPPNTEHFFDHLWKWGVDIHPIIPSYITFDGVNDEVDLANDTSLWSGTLSKFSVSVWIYPTAVNDGQNREVFDHGSASAQGFECEIDDNNAGEIRFRIKNAAGGDLIALSTALVANRWQHITCVYDNSLGSANIKIYVNKVLGGTTANLTESITQSADMELASPSNDFKGHMRDFRFWKSKALTTTEIGDVFDNSESAPTPDYWLKMEEGSGSTIVDSISGTKSGSLGAIQWGGGILPLGNANSLALNIDDGDGAHFFRADAGLTTNYNFTTTSFSVCFWIMPVQVTGGTSDVVAYRFSTGSNNWFIELDSSSDQKLWARMEIGGTVVSKREYPTPLSPNTWYFVVLTWDSQAQVLSLRVNDGVDGTTGKGSSQANTIDGMFFGGFPNVSTNAVFRGYLTGITYYQHQPSIQFDGTNDFVNCGNHASLWSQGLTKFSFSFWIYPTVAWDGTTRWILNQGGGSVHGKVVYINSTTTGRITFELRRTDTTLAEAQSDSLVANTWNFVTCVYDNSLASANMKIYVNGVQGGTTANLTETINFSGELHLSENSTDFAGFMQGFQWWTTKALNAKEVSDLYNLKYTGPDPNYWLPMLDGDISTNASRTQDIMEPLKNKYASFSGAVWATGKGRILSNPEKTNLYNYNTVTPTQKPLKFGDGQYGLLPASISLDGTNDFVDCGTHTDLWAQALNKFSFSFWIYPTIGWDTFGRELVEKGIGAAHGFQCVLDENTSGWITFEVRNSVGSFFEARFDTLVLNQWQFITCVYDNSLGSANIKIYVNGVLGGTTGTLNEVINQVDNLVLGESDKGIAGQIQDFKWWTNVALSEKQIITLYNGEYEYPEVDYWLPLDEGTGNPKDKKSGIKTATLQNGATWSTNHH